jgi:hypothetical protein
MSLQVVHNLNAISITNLKNFIDGHAYLMLIWVELTITMILFKVKKVSSCTGERPIHYVMRIDFAKELDI